MSPDVGPPGPPGTIANSPPRARLSALVRSLGWSSEPCASRPGSRCTACAPRSADVAAASTTLRAARSSQPPRRCEALAPASPTSPFCTRSLGAADPWLLDGTETAARKAECARFGAAALACIALLMSRDRGGMEPRQWCDAERRSRNARDASGHLLALVGLLRHRAMHEYALCAMLAVGSEAPHATRAHVCAALVGRVRVCRPPQRGRRKGTWRALARQDASFKVPLRRDQVGIPNEHDWQNQGFLGWEGLFSGQNSPLASLGAARTMRDLPARGETDPSPAPSARTLGLA